MVCRSILIFLAALLPLMAGNAQAQVAPASSTANDATSASSDWLKLLCSGTLRARWHSFPPGIVPGQCAGKT